MSALALYKRHCMYLPAMAGWWVFSAVQTFYNKAFYGETFGAFPCPLLVTSVHFFEQWMFSYILSCSFPDFYGGNVVKKMSWSTFLRTSIPCGLAFDIGLANLSLVRISVTFYTMVKASFPLWIIIFSILFRLEKMTCKLILVGLLITTGEILVAFGQAAFDTTGFLLILGGVICGGIRWALVQLKVQKLDPPLSGPMATMRLLACSMFFSMLLMSLIFEQPWRKLGPSNSEFFSDFDNGIRTTYIVLFGGVPSIGIVFCQYWLILNSNAIVMMIGCVLKDTIFVILGVLMLGDSLTAINISGIVVVNIGVLFHKVTLPSKSNYDGSQKNEVDNNYVLYLNDDDDDDDDDDCNEDYNYDDDLSALLGEGSQSDSDIPPKISAKHLELDGKESLNTLDAISPRRARMKTGVAAVI